MPTDTPDQQITTPVDGDSADAPVGFLATVADVEPRLVRRYTDEADRTARMLSLTENAISTLATENRVEVYDGAAHISLFTRSVYARSRVTATQNVGPSNTTLQNVTNMAIALPAINGAIYQFRGLVWYNSNATADIKFAFTMPAGGATMRWGIVALATGAASVTGDVNLSSITASGTSVSYGGAAAADALAVIEGEITMGTVAGNLQLQAAQATSDASSTNILARSRLESWRIS